MRSYISLITTAFLQKHGLPNLISHKYFSEGSNKRDGNLPFFFLPYNISITITWRCDSRCYMCNIWKNKTHELSFDEWKRVFASMGRSPFFATFTGGNQFLRDDFSDIVNEFIRICKPRIITIPISGTMPAKIYSQVLKIAKACEKNKVLLYLNLSLDGLRDVHNSIRGVKSYQKTLMAFRMLKRIRKKGIHLGIITVVSKMNKEQLEMLQKEVARLKPKSHYIEFVQERRELCNIGEGIELSQQDVADIACKLQSYKSQKHIGLKGTMRKKYYSLVNKAVSKKITPVCYAGISSIQIAPNGDVWRCGQKGEVIGNLRDTQYNIKRILFAVPRKKIKGCFCYNTNVQYSNMLNGLVP
ncbi:MAG: radical SAM protein [Candidatus Woesearchaeota archaeon]